LGWRTAKTIFHNHQPPIDRKPTKNRIGIFQHEDAALDLFIEDMYIDHCYLSTHLFKFSLKGIPPVNAAIQTCFEATARMPRKDRRYPLMSRMRLKL